MPLLKKLEFNYSTILVILLIIASFLLGSLWTEIQYLQKKNTAPTVAQVAGTAQEPTQFPQPKISLDTIKGLFEKDLIKFGDGNKKLLFVEIADPSCPYCQAAAGKNPQLNEQMGENFKLVSDGGFYVSPVDEMRKLVNNGQASFVYIYQNGHGKGEMAMKALYCANDQGKFWEAHDKIMSNAGYNLINNDVKNDKSASGKLMDFLNDTLDPLSLQVCLESGKYDNRLAQDIQLARQLGANGTPGFFINTNFFSGAYNWTEMKNTADANLN
ncbi:DsbA family protein [Candidatus Microgenomates bacterium]|nr:MAG: DsbA family protein [Candidatus Microgenomates bacterium]